VPSPRRSSRVRLDAFALASSEAIWWLSFVSAAAKSVLLMDCSTPSCVSWPLSTVAWLRRPSSRRPRRQVSRGAPPLVIERDDLLAEARLGGRQVLMLADPLFTAPVALAASAGASAPFPS